MFDEKGGRDNDKVTSSFQISNHEIIAGRSHHHATQFNLVLKWESHIQICVCYHSEINLRTAKRNREQKEIRTIMSIYTVARSVNYSQQICDASKTSSHRNKNKLKMKSKLMLFSACSMILLEENQLAQKAKGSSSATVMLLNVIVIKTFMEAKSLRKKILLNCQRLFHFKHCLRRVEAMNVNVVKGWIISTSALFPSPRRGM